MLVPAKAGIEIHPRRAARTAADFLERFLAHFPYAVHTILTDGANVYRERQALTMGSEFTDRFAVDPRLRGDRL